MTVQQFLDTILNGHPEIKQIVDLLRAGELTEEQALTEMVGVVQKQGLESALQKAAQDLQILSVNPPPALYRGAPGLPKMNPLVEAAILERAQFDGDVPEFRTGVLPEGVMPAVPVLTKSTDPVTIGRQLQTASQEVRRAIEEAQQDYGHMLQTMLETPGGAVDFALELTQTGIQSPTGVVGYEAGKEASMHLVAQPTGSDLLALSPEELQQASWLTISTNQGRRSAVSGMALRLQDGLTKVGLGVDIRPVSEDPAAPIQAGWTMDIRGQESMQSNFSFIDVATSSILQKLVKKTRDAGLAKAYLEVSTLDTVDLRRVGWVARLFPMEG